MAGSGVLAFIGPDGNVWTMAANGGSKRRISLDGTPDTPYGPPAWSGDGLRLLSVRRDPPALVTFDLPDLAPYVVAARHPVLAAWGPGRSEITRAEADSGERVIHIEVIAGSARRPVVTLPWKGTPAMSPGFPTREALLPHANQFVWSRHHNILVLTWPDVLGEAGAVVDIASGSVRDLANFLPEPAQGARITSVCFIDAGTLFACVQESGHGRVAQIALEGGVQWVRGADALAAHRSPSHSQIYYVQWPTHNPSLWRVPAIGGVPEEVLAGRLSYLPPDHFQNCQFWGLPSFAPDGSMLAVDQLQVDGEYGTPLYQAIETIWLATADGRDARMLGLGRQVTWQPAPPA